MGGLDWRIGEYVLEYPIAEGKFGVVYKAVSASGETVAVKLVPSTGTPEAKEKMAAERRGALLQLQFGLRYDVVPKVFDQKPFDKAFFGIVMELVEAPQLTSLIARGPLPHRDAVQYALCISDFLEKAHRFETVIDDEPYELIVHADLKPDHVLLVGPDRIKVLDFGIAKALAKTTVMTTNNWGTAPYASPERLESGQINEQVDLWSLGVMLFEMVSGHRPYWRLEHDTSRLDRAIRLSEPPEALPTWCPQGLAAMISKLLAPQIERRYGSAVAISQDLKAFLDNKPVRASSEFVTAETIRIPPASIPGFGGQPPRQVPPTEPMPGSAPVPANATGPDAAVAAPSVLPRVLSRPRLLRRAAWAVMLMAVTGLLTTEAVAWVGAERMLAELGSLDGRAVAPKRQDYERLRRWSLLHIGPRLLLNGPLKDRLVSVADAMIADYRQEESTVAEAQWRQAREALAWAAELAPSDASIAPKQLDCDAHVDRIAGQARSRTNPALAAQIYKQAIEKFRRAASLDPRSPDPYLGLSRIYIYGLGDVDQGAAAIHEAEARGHKPGWRERAQLGDGYLRRGDKNRRQAESSRKRSQRDEELSATMNARDDYARCVESFAPILDRGRAQANYQFCKRHLEVANRELESNSVEKQ